LYSFDFLITSSVSERANCINAYCFYNKKIFVKVRQCLLLFGTESFVFQFAIQNLKIKIYRTIILPVVQYGCETSSLTLREERSLRVFENRVLRRLFGPKRDEVA